MFGSTILEIGISFAFLFMMLSLIASSIQEGIEAWLKVRASNLEKGIKELLQDPNLAAAVYQHPLIVGLYQGPFHSGRKNLTSVLPTYIPSSHFASALLDLVVRGPVDQTQPKPSGEEAKIEALSPLKLDDIRTRINENTLITPTLRRILLLAIDHAEGDAAKAQQYLEQWFDKGMERVSGWYRRHTRTMLMSIGLIIAVAFNVNVFRIANELYHNENLRTALVAQAEAAQAAGEVPTGANAQETLKKSSDSLAAAQFPIGWAEGSLAAPLEKIKQTPFPEVLLTIMGWLFTAFGISFGATFWFDALGKLISLRATVKPLEQAVSKLTQPPADSGKDDGKQP